MGECVSAGKKHTRLFIAGVVAWRGANPPTPRDLQDLPIADYAFAHIKTITSSGGQIIGATQIDFGHLPEYAESLSLPTWGYAMPTILAERLVANGS